MNNRLQNGLVGLAAAAILAGGYCGMDAVGTLLPTGEEEIAVYPADTGGAALMMDGQEKLTFYPWTLYDEAQCVPPAEYWGDATATKEMTDLNGMIDDALIYLDTCREESVFQPLAGTVAYANSLRVQPDTGMMFLPDYSYRSITGEEYRLDLAMNAARQVEALHVRAAVASSPLSNDVWQDGAAQLEKALAKHREQLGAAVAGGANKTDEAEVDFDPPRNDRDLFARSADSWSELTWPQDLFAQFIELYLRLHPEEIDWNDYSYSHRVNNLMSLIDNGVTNMVYYENNILLFFLPNDGGDFDPALGLLLYIDPEEQALTGFSLLDLAG